EMNPTRIDKPVLAITGASGLIGTRLVEAFADEYAVVALDIEPLPIERAGVAWIRCDLTDDESVTDALDRLKDEHGGNIASVIHLAAYYDFSGEPSPLYDELTVNGTRRLMRGLRALSVEQFVFSSSLLVQESSADGHLITPYSPVAAEWDYPRSKLEAEKVIADERGEISTVILRIAGVYNEDCHSIPIAQQIARIHERQLESYFFPGDKTCGQAFVHLEDLVSCFRAVVERRSNLSPHSMFIIGEEDVMSYEELQEQIGTYLHGQEWPTIRIPKVAAKAGAWVKDKLSSDDDAPFIKPWMIDLADQNYPVSVQHARERLGWEPKHTLRGTLPEMIGRLHLDPSAWYKKNGLPVPPKVEQESAGVAK
ncbi:MAG: NAD(P)-dependent oxidoreductase, partial [Pirellulaceae bacterium]